MISASRTMALPLGRGAATLATRRPLPTEPASVPSMCLAGILPSQNNASISLDLSNSQPAPGGGASADCTAWPEFHNGVAIGLRYAGDINDRSTSHGERGSGGGGGGRGERGQVCVLYRHSLVPERPEVPSYCHAGQLLAVGLAGRMSQMPWTMLYRSVKALAGRLK